MDDTLSLPSGEALASVISAETAVESAIEVEDGWLRVAGVERSLLMCLDAKGTAASNQLIRGAELLEPADTGVVFLASPEVYALDTGDSMVGTSESLPTSSTESFMSDLTGFILHLLTVGFDQDPESDGIHPVELFDSMLREGEDEERTQRRSELYQGEFYSDPLVDGEKDVIDLVVRWILRDNPRIVLDFCPGEWALSTALVEYCDSQEKDTEFHLVNLPGRPVAELVAAYQAPQWYSSVEAEHQFETILTDLNDQAELGDFRKDAGSDTAPSPDVVVSGLCPRLDPDSCQLIQDRADELSLGRGRTSLSTYLAAEGIVSSVNGGRGAFVLTLRELTQSTILQHAFAEGRIHAILVVDHPNRATFDVDPRECQAIILFEKEDCSVNTDEVRIIELTSTDLDSDVHKLVHASSDALTSDGAADIDGASFLTVTPADLLELETELVLREPQLVPFLRDEDTQQLGELIEEINRGIQTRANDFFYFDSLEISEIDIPSRFLTPVLRRVPSSSEEQLHTITTRKTDSYAFDIRGFLNEFDCTPTEENVLEELRQQGYDNVTTYIEDHRALSHLPGLQRTDIWFCPFDRATADQPDLLFARFSDGTWYRYRADDVIIDQRWYRVWCGDTDPGTLHRLLNSEPYQQLLAHFGQSMSEVHSEYMIRDLSRLPVNVGPLDEGLDNLTFPPESRRGQRQLDQAVVDRCQNRAAREALETLLEPDDQFAWAWFLSPEEYDEFQRIYDVEEGDARGFVADRFDKKEVREMLNDIAQSPLHVERWETIEELADEYRDGRYRLFLYGATPQFEGFIMDWARKNGHEVVMRGTRPYVRINGQSGEEEKEFPKGLGKLIQEFIPRGFGDFLQDDITDLRNAITHGEIVEPSHQQATICLLALHTLALEVSEGRLGIQE